MAIGKDFPERSNEHMTRVMNQQSAQQTALYRQVSQREIRIAALDFAIRRGSKEFTYQEIVECARAFAEFLAND